MFSRSTRTLVLLASFLAVVPSAQAVVLTHVDVHYDVGGGFFSMQGMTVDISSGSFTVGFASGDSATNGPISPGSARLKALDLHLATPLPLPTGFMGSTFHHLQFANVAIDGTLLPATVRTDGFVSGRPGNAMGSVANGSAEAATFMIQSWFHDNVFVTGMNRYLQVNAMFSDSFSLQVAGTEIGRTIVPEPATGGLVFAGLAAVAAAARCARRRS